jgi:hypothetical protein
MNPDEPVTRIFNSISFRCSQDLMLDPTIGFGWFKKLKVGTKLKYNLVS